MKSINSRAKTPAVTGQFSARIFGAHRGLFAALLAVWLPACGGAAAQSAPPSHDRPVPASEQRAELKLELELEQRAGCEEDFDLALYQDPGVELIDWREPFGVCKARQVTIRYLPGRISKDALLDRVKELARAVEVR